MLSCVFYLREGSRLAVFVFPLRLCLLIWSKEGLVIDESCSSCCEELGSNGFES
jgi:hypothetical protein